MIALETYDFSPERGFLPKRDPVPFLSIEHGNADYILEWEYGARDLLDYLPQGIARQKIQSLPPLPLVNIPPEHYERVMLLCSYFGHAFVWGGDTPAPFVPANIAVPWCSISQSLERLPVLSYASYAMNNWKRIDSDGPIAFGNLALLQKFLGGFDESGFILVHVDIEAKAGGAGWALWNGYHAVLQNEPDAVGEHLLAAAVSLQQMNHTLQGMPRWCDPYIYYNRVRPYIHGWKDNPTFPDGIVYQGCFNGKPQKFRGETGAQSSVIPLLDAFLGIKHPKDRLWHYLKEMRTYMPYQHRMFLATVEDHSMLIRDYVRVHGELGELYNHCVTQLYTFRETHRAYAKLYVEDQQERLGNPTRVGTGGTPFSVYLKAHSDNTAKALLE